VVFLALSNCLQRVSGKLVEKTIHFWFWVLAIPLSMIRIATFSVWISCLCLGPVQFCSWYFLAGSSGFYMVQPLSRPVQHLPNPVQLVFIRFIVIMTGSIVSHPAQDISVPVQWYSDQVRHILTSSLTSNTDLASFTAGSVLFYTGSTSFMSGSLWFTLFLG
jgi:hypothetical protein